MARSGRLLLPSARPPPQRAGRNPSHWLCQPAPPARAPQRRGALCPALRRGGGGAVLACPAARVFASPALSCPVCPVLSAHPADSAAPRQTLSIPNAEISPETVTNMHQTSIEGLEDMVGGGVGRCVGEQGARRAVDVGVCVGRGDVVGSPRMLSLSPRPALPICTLVPSCTTLRCATTRMTFTRTLAQSSRPSTLTSVSR